MRVADHHIDEFWKQGFTVVPGFIAGDELAEAQDALWQHYPTPEEFFADPDAHAELRASQFAGLRLFAFKSWSLNRLLLHPDLIDLARRLLGTADVELYKGELWGKYAGAIDYDQAHHRDFVGHSLVVPRRDHRFLQVTTFLYLSDVTELDGATRIVPAPIGDAVPRWPTTLEPGQLADQEIAAVGPAGTLVVYRTDILHRGADFGGPGRSRFMLLADYQSRGAAPWNGKMSWPGRPSPGLTETIVRASVEQRNALGFPPPGSDYWDDDTRADVATRYPGIDLTPYGA